MKPKSLASKGPAGLGSLAVRPYARGIAGTPLIEPDTIRFQSNRISDKAFLRGGCVAHSAYGFAVLYIRTNDSAVDTDSLGRIAGALEMKLSPVCELSTANSGIKAKVSLHQSKPHSFYSVMVQNVPRAQLADTMRLVETIAGKLFEIKEEPYFRDDASRDFRAELSKAGYL